MEEDDARATLLIIDDSPVNLRLMTGILEPAGYLTLTATSGAEALELVATHAVDLVLLDVVMPGMDGYDVCMRLREQPSTQYVPIIMLTSSDSPERLHALEIGADDFVRRPVDQPELLARVRSLLRIKRYHDRIEQQSAELERLNASLASRVLEQVGHIDRLSRLRRFVAPQVAELLVSSAEPHKIERHRREIAVVACGLAGFSAFADSVEPEVVMQVLEELYATLGPVVHRFEGTVGGLFEAEAGLTVFFNDPVPCDQSARQAARMALSMRDELSKRATTWRRRGHELELRIGIDKGFATLGSMGFEGRHDYAAVGRVVSVATRLCEHASAGQILVTRAIHVEVEPELATSSLGEVRLAGLPRALEVFSL